MEELDLISEDLEKCRNQTYTSDSAAGTTSAASLSISVL